MGIVEMIMPAVVISILGYGVFWGFIRKTNRTLFRFVFLVIAMGASFVLAKMFSQAASDIAFDFLKSAGIEGVSELLENSKMAELADGICRMLATPVLFVVFYTVLKPVSWFPYKILSVLFRVKGPRFFGRLTGAVAGILCGLVGLTVFVVPVYGYLDLAGEVVTAFEDETDSEEDQEILQMLDLDASPIAKQLYDILGRPLFDALTTTTYKGESITLREELKGVLQAMSDAQVLLEKSPEKYGKNETQAIKNLAHDVGESRILSTVLSAMISDMAKGWMKNEMPYGVEEPSMGDELQNIMDAFWIVLADSNEENIEEDLLTVADVFDVFIRHDMLTAFSGSGDSSEFSEELVSDGIVKELSAVLNKNGRKERMEPVRTAIVDTSMRMMLVELGVSKDLRENRGALMNEIAVSLKDASKDGRIDAEQVNKNMKEALVRENVKLGDDVVKLVADGLAESFTPEELEAISTDELVNRLIDRFASAEKNGN